MMSWKDVIMAQEHHKDLLREAEAARLVRQFSRNNRRTTLWQKVRSFFAAGGEKETPAEEEVYCCPADAVS